MEKIDYNEIVKRHMEVMNSEFNMDQNNEDTYANDNSFKHSHHIEENVNVAKEKSKVDEVPYFFNFNTIPAPENKVNIETRYVIPGTNSNIY